jgi:hypothetical protein
MFENGVFKIKVIKVRNLRIFFSVQRTWARGGVVVEALRYKPEGRGFGSR